MKEFRSVFKIYNLFILKCVFDNCWVTLKFNTVFRFVLIINADEKM